MMAQYLISSDAAIPRLAPLAPKPQESQCTHKDTGRRAIIKTTTKLPAVRRKETNSIAAEDWEAKKTGISTPTLPNP